MGFDGLIGVVGLVGVAGAGVIHSFPFQKSPVLQVMQVIPLKYDEGGQVATQFPSKLMLYPTH